MLILALDTTTRAGSVALMRDDTLVASQTGDPQRTHGERLPGDLVHLLTRHDVPLSAVDVYAVAAGPGSFTGLRIGIATMQGLALAHGKALVGVSALDALALSAQRQLDSFTFRQAQGERNRDVRGASFAEGFGGATQRETRNRERVEPRTHLSVTQSIAVWMDAQRQEVFAAIYDAADLSCLDGPAVADPAELHARWRPFFQGGQVWFVGDGAVAHREILAPASGSITVVDPTPLLAPAVAALAAREGAAGRLRGPEAIRPLYVRRPDAELARDRARARVDR